MTPLTRQKLYRELANAQIELRAVTLRRILHVLKDDRIRPLAEEALDAVLHNCLSPELAAAGLIAEADRLDKLDDHLARDR